MLMDTNEYITFLESIKAEITQTRARAVGKVNSELICLYWRIGSELNSRKDWGASVIDTLSKDIRVAFPQIKGFSARNLRYMAKFARECNEEFLQTVSAKLSWSHTVKLMDKLKDDAQRHWYGKEAIENGWSLAVLDHQIDLKLYERQVLSGKVSNFTRTLPAPDSELAQQALKDPYIFNFITAKQGQQEHDIEEQMVTNVTNLLLELGTGFAFMGRQYHLMVGGEDFYIDLLFYNTKLRCYVVIELKNDKFKPEFTGQLSFYVAAVDGELAGEHDNPTIGLLLCKEKNDTVAEYSLKDVNASIGVSEYRLGDVLPEEYIKYLPTPEDLQARI